MLKHEESIDRVHIFVAIGVCTRQIQVSWRADRQRTLIATCSKTHNVLKYEQSVDRIDVVVAVHVPHKANADAAVFCAVRYGVALGVGKRLHGQRQWAFVAHGRTRRHFKRDIGQRQVTHSVRCGPDTTASDSARPIVEIA